MTSPNEDSSARSSVREMNPFIAFRHFADENFCSLLQSLANAVPSNIIFPPSHRRLTPFDEQARQRDEELKEMQFAKCFWRAMGGIPDEIDPDDRVPSRDEYFKEMQYAKSLWRSMGQIRDETAYDDHAPSQNEIMQRLACLMPFLGRLSVADPLQQQAEIREEEEAQEKNQMTELDAYDRLFCEQQKDSASTFAAFAENSLASPANDKPSIISTLTTTEKNTLPDGSVHTRIVLKKRFTDGREESSETVHSVRGPQEQAFESAPARLEELRKHGSPITSMLEDRERKRKCSKEDTTKKPGWFWS